LSRLQRHRAQAGETLDRIAQRYNLLPNTLISLNPSLKNGKVSVGSEILIPPFNGIRLEAPKGATWQDLSKAYGVRADLLFELNGCQIAPRTVFIPGVNWQGTRPPRDNYTGLAGYPLPTKAAIALGYGWQPQPSGQGSFFHSGIDLLAAPDTPVLAADRGTVVYVGQEGTYGFLVVVDHGNNRQTRYAHLSRFNIKMGQMVNTGDILGFVGTTGKPDVNQPHLHFEVRYRLPVGWVAQDPLLHLVNRP
jgi:murein DD-endopeptidase MepM/ murein hydrolase activator NlpD